MLYIRLVLNADGFWRGGLVEENANDFAFKQDMQIWMLAVLKKRVYISMCSILSLAVWSNVSVPFLIVVSLVLSKNYVFCAYTKAAAGLQIL